MKLAVNLYHSLLIQERKVQEFVVVHGQILLNQFNNYPNEKVKKSAFAVALKDLMEMRRHCKLYQPKKKKSCRSTVVNKNPMKVSWCSAVSIRSL